MEHTAVVDAGYTHTHTHTHKILLILLFFNGTLTPLPFSFFLAYALGPGCIPTSIYLDLMIDPKKG